MSAKPCKTTVESLVIQQLFRHDVSFINIIYYINIHTFYLIVQVIFVLCNKHFGSSSDTEIKIGTWFTGLGVSTSMILSKTNLTRANWSESKVYVWGLLTKFDPLVRVWTLTNWGFLSAGVIRWAYKKKNASSILLLFDIHKDISYPTFNPNIVIFIAISNTLNSAIQYSRIQQGYIYLFTLYVPDASLLSHDFDAYQNSAGLSNPF